MKNIELAIKIGARVGGMVKGMQNATNSVNKVQQTIKKLNAKKIDIVTNDSSVMKVKKSLENVDSKLENLKKMKTKLYLGLDKDKVSEINNHLKTVKSKIKMLESQEKKIELEIKTTTDEKELIKLKKSLDKTREKIIGLSNEKIGLDGELVKVNEANGKVNEKIKRTESLVRSLNSKRLGLKDDLKEVEDQARKTNSTIKKIEDTVRKINGTKLKIQQTIDRRDKFKQSAVSNVARVASVAMPIATGIEFESSMARVKAITMATDKQFKALESTALQLGSSTTFSSSQVAEGMQFLSMAGFKTNQTIKAMPGVLNLASAGAVDLATTADIASNVLSGFGIKAGKMGMVADVMAKAITNSNFGVVELGDTMKNVAPSALALGASVHEVTALAGKLADVGLKGGDAGTSLKIMYSRMATMPKPAAKALDKLGLKIKDSKGNFTGMIPLLQKVRDKIKDMGNVEQSTILKDLFGGEAVGAAISLIAKADGTLQKYEKTLKGSIGHAQKMADIQNATTAGSLKALASAIEGISIKFSKMFTPAITYVARKLAIVSGGIGKMMDKFPKLTSAVSIGAVALLAGGVALASFAVVAGFAMNGVRMLRLGLLAQNATMLATRGSTLLTSLSFGKMGKIAMATGRMMLKTPIGIAIAAIALGAVMIYKYWEPIKGFFKGVALGIGDALGGLKTIFYTVFGAIEHYTRPILEPLLATVKVLGRVFKWVFGSIYEDIKKLLSPLTAVSDSVGKATEYGRNWGQWIGYIGAGLGGVLALKMAFAVLAPAIGAVGTVLAFVGRAMLMNPIGLAVTAIAGAAYLIYDNWEGISSWFSSKWESVKGIFSSTWDWIKTKLSWTPLGLIINNWDSITGFFSNWGANLKTFLGSEWNRIKAIVSWNPLDTIRSMWKGVMNFFNNFSLANAGKNMLTSLVDGILSKVKFLTDAVGSVTRSIREYFNYSPAKRGALKDIHKVKLFETVAGGLNDKSLLKAVNNTTAKIGKSLAMVGTGLALSGSLAVAQPTLKQPKSLLSNIPKLSNRSFQTEENLLTKSLPNLQNRSFNTLENLKLKSVVPLKDRSFKTKEILSQANIPKLPNRVFNTKENLLTKSLPTLNNRSFSTLENLKLKSVAPLKDRSFKTKEILSQANVPKLSNRSFEKIEPLGQSMKKENVSSTNNHVNNSKIYVTMGDIILQSTDGKIAEPHLLKEEIREMIEDGIRAAKENDFDRSFSDVGGLG